MKMNWFLRTAAIATVLFVTAGAIWVFVASTERYISPNLDI